MTSKAKRSEWTPTHVLVESNEVGVPMVVRPVMLVAVDGSNGRFWQQTEWRAAMAKQIDPEWYLSDGRIYHRDEVGPRARASLMSVR